MFGKDADPVIVDALNKLLILHADHEQNCSTSTVRIVGSSNTNLFSSIFVLFATVHWTAHQLLFHRMFMRRTNKAHKKWMRLSNGTLILWMILNTNKPWVVAKLNNFGKLIIGGGPRNYETGFFKTCSEMIANLKSVAVTLAYFILSVDATAKRTFL